MKSKQNKMENGNMGSTNDYVVNDIAGSTQEFRFLEKPVYVGGYNITPHSSNQFIVNSTKKPLFIHRFFCRILLGWVWVDDILK